MSEREARLGQHGKRPEPRESSPLVGRIDEVHRLDNALDRAVAGKGGVVILAGDAGIGKTRLAHEALKLARLKGFLTLEGRAYPLEGGLAYAPLLDALVPMLRGRDPLARAALVRELPELGRLFGGLGLAASQPLGDPALEKTRLFNAVATLFERLARDTPLVVLIDDLHWADPASIELLHYIARGINDQQLLLLGTYRTEEIDSARGLRALLGSLRRGDTFVEIALRRLAEDEVRALAGGMLGAGPTDRLVALLDARSGGTPLFVEELLRSLRDGGALTLAGELWTLGAAAPTRLPPRVEGLIRERLARLDPGDRAVLDLVAVSGTSARYAVLESVSGLDGQSLLSSLLRLGSAGLIIEELAGADVLYNLTHPLIQEVAYTSLAEMARRHTHAAIAVALERHYAGEIDQLARHYRSAGSAADPERALVVLLSAGEHARAVHANDEAAQYFGAALALVREGRRPELMPELLQWLGEAWERVGELAAAEAVWTEALVLYEKAGDTRRAAPLRRQLAQVEWERGHFDTAQGHIEAGLFALASREPSREHVDLLRARVTMLGRIGKIDAVQAATSELLELARKVESPHAEVEALHARLTTAVDTNYLAMRERLAQIYADAEAAEDLLLAQRTGVSLYTVNLILGDHRAAHDCCESGLRIASRLGAPAIEAFVLTGIMFPDIYVGRWDEAMGHAAEGMARTTRGGQSRLRAGLLATRALVHIRRGALTAAESDLSEARALFGDGRADDRRIFGLIDQAEVELALERGNPQRALTVAKAFEPSPGPFPSIALALLGEAAAAAGEPQRALAVAGRIAAMSPSASALPHVLACRVEGLGYRMLAETERALPALAVAAEGFQALGMPFDAARARLEWAGLQAPSNAEAAACALQECLTTFERLGAGLYAGRTRRLLQSLGVRPRATQGARRSEGSLSPREREVAVLVAHGLTTPEIAARLVLSPRTVSAHLDRMFSRVGVNSRTALARYVIESGILSSGPD